ncbi:MAG: aminopeptidase P family protein [Dehalococcoidia bacterium]|nr:aminopeptidase P family protein [Dehalococcoidia bacterium]
MTGRLDRVRAAIGEEGLDALLVSAAVEDMFGRNAVNRQWLTGFTGSVGYAVVTRERALIALDSRYWVQGEAECVPRGFEVWKREGKWDDWVPGLLREAELTGAKIGVSRADMNLGEYLRFQESAGKLPWALRPQWGPAGKVIEKLRTKKDADELAALQRAIDIADAAFERAAAEFVAGTTERQLAARIRELVKELGAEDISFDTIVAAGPNGAMPHANPSDMAIPEGAPIVVDMGAQFEGYCSDLTRTFVAGTPDAQFRAVYEVVFEAQQRAIEKVEPGMTSVQAHELAHGVIRAAGFGEQFGHGLGHGVGLEVHEDPYLGPTGEDVLEEGMVFTIEPGIYLPGEFGVRIEDVVVLENGKARVLSHAPKLTPAGAIT